MSASSEIRSVTDSDSDERFHLYRLCQCTTCDGTGKADYNDLGVILTTRRCQECRGEGRTRDLVSTCGPEPEAIGTALYTLALENEWEECPIGVLDTMPELQETDEPRKWLVRPWLPSARNLSDAGRTLRQAQEKK